MQRQAEVHRDAETQETGTRVHGTYPETDTGTTSQWTHDKPLMSPVLS